jgi:anti-anti-sigma regulatory factor
MAFSLFSKPSNKPKGGAAADRPTSAEVRPANDSKRPEGGAPHTATPRKEKGQSTVLLGVGKDWRPSFSKIEVDERAPALCPALENAALLFASGQIDAARATLADAVINDPEASTSMLAWLSLFDILQRCGDKAAADELALKFVVAFERSPPIWDESRTQGASRDADAKAKAGAFVRFSGELATDNPGFESLVKAVNAAPKCRLDFSGISSVDEQTAGAVAEVLRGVRRKSYPLQIQGADALRRVLEGGVEVGKPVREAYWSLLLELLQWLNDSAAFEEQAVNYAISFEVSPPSWEGRRAEAAAPAAPAEISAAAADEVASDIYPLQGVLTGPGEPQVMRLREFGRNNASVIIDCQALERIDFVCAGALLNELEGVERLQKPIQVSQASPIVQALLLVIGVKPRYFHPRIA